jgi:hypothetical protein
VVAQRGNASLRSARVLAKAWLETRRACQLVCRAAARSVSETLTHTDRSSDRSRR